eukprot:jgi/Mesvir1/2707/Mv05104-RA.1
MNVGSRNFSREQRSQMRQVFEYMDTDFDGLLSLGQAKHAGRLLGTDITEPGDESLKVDFEAFAELIYKYSFMDLKTRGGVLTKINMFCTALDPLRTGQVTAAALHKFFTDAGDDVSLAAVKEMLEAMDDTLVSDTVTPATLKDFVMQLHFQNTP